MNVAVNRTSQTLGLVTETMPSGGKHPPPPFPEDEQNYSFSHYQSTQTVCVKIPAFIFCVVHNCLITEILLIQMFKHMIGYS